MTFKKVYFVGYGLAGVQIPTILSTEQSNLGTGH
jgi:hypothetical protein